MQLDVADVGLRDLIVDQSRNLFGAGEANDAFSPLLSLAQATSREVCQCFAQHWSADAEPLRHAGGRRQRVPVTQSAITDQLEDGLGDLIGECAAAEDRR